MQGWQRERGSLPSPPSRNLLIGVTEASFWSSKSRSLPWLASTHQLHPLARLPPSCACFQQGKSWEMSRASSHGGARTRAEPLGKEQKAACAQPGFEEVKGCPMSHGSARMAKAMLFLGRDQGKGEAIQAEPEPHPCGMLQGRACSPGDVGECWVAQRAPSCGGHDATGLREHRDQRGVLWRYSTLMGPQGCQRLPSPGGA